MKKQLLIIGTVIAFLMPLSSFKTGNGALNAKIVQHPTITELGDFEYGGVVYAVYGDASAGTVTAVKNFNTGVDVYSFEGYYQTTGWPLPHGTHPWMHVSGYGTSSTSSYFVYNGGVLYW